MALTEEQQRLLQEADMIRQQEQEQQQQEKQMLFPTDPSYYEGGKPTFGVVGHGFVGKAVERALHPDLNKFIVDPIYKTNIDQLVEAKPILTYVCTPTPVQGNGRIDAADTVDAVLKLIRLTKSAVILKSTVTPDIISKLIRAVEQAEAAHRFIYAPEFLTEKNADHEYCNPTYVVFGGIQQSVSQYMEFLVNNTYIKLDKEASVQIVHPMEASFIKYAINSFLAMKVTFMNQLVSAIEDELEEGVSPLQVMKALADEPRLGNSHWRVPGPDGKKGFGGACFPKDISALVNYTSKMSLLEEVLSINNEIRSEYELDDREKVANVKFKADEVSVAVDEEPLTEDDLLDTTGQIELDLFDEDAA